MDIFTERLFVKHTTWDSNTSQMLLCMITAAYVLCCNCQAVDADQGVNAALSYSLSSGNIDGAFSIDPNRYNRTKFPCDACTGGCLREHYC